MGDLRGRVRRSRFVASREAEHKPLSREPAPRKMAAEGNVFLSRFLEGRYCKIVRVCLARRAAGGSIDSAEAGEARRGEAGGCNDPQGCAGARRAGGALARSCRQCAGRGQPTPGHAPRATPTAPRVDVANPLRGKASMWPLSCGARPDEATESPRPARELEFKSFARGHLVPGGWLVGSGVRAGLARALRPEPARPHDSTMGVWM